MKKKIMTAAFLFFALNLDSARAESSLKTVSHIVKSGSYKGNSRSIMLCGTKKLMPLFTAGAGIEVRNIRIEEVAKK